MTADGPLRVAASLTIPAAELRWRFDPSGGPGGQHANKTSTRAEVSWEVARSEAVTEEVRSRLLERLGGRAPGGVITIAVDETRSQWRNRVIARRRLTAVLDEALRPEAERIATRIPASARRRRLERKRRRAELKRGRRAPEPDD